MSLYEYSLFNIYNQLKNNKMSSTDYKYLPQDILDDLNRYVKYTDEDYTEKGFYKSLKFKHFVFAEYFLSQIIIYEKIGIINYALIYIKDIESAEFLIRKGANDWDYGLLGSVYNNNMNMIKYFIKLGARSFNNAMIQAIINNNIKLIEYFISLGANNFD